MKKFSQAFVCLLLFFISIQQGQTQRISYDLPFRVEHSQFVFEGTVVSQESYIDASTNNIFTSNLIQVHKVFKGQLETELVQIITKGGEVEGRFQFQSHGVSLFKDKTAIFFSCSTNMLSPNKDITTKLRICEDDITLELKKGIAFDKWGSYENIENDLYQAIEKITGFARKLISLNPEEQNKGFDIGNNILLNAIDNSNSNRSIICYDFTNIIFSILNGVPQVAFDIMVHSNVVGGKYAGSQLVIEYDTLSFGSNIAASNAISIAKGEVVENTNYSIQQNDLTKNKFQMDIGAPTSPADLFELSGFSKTLCRVTIELSGINISNSTGASFSQAEMQENSYYYHSSTGVTKYDLVCLESEIDLTDVSLASNTTLNYYYDNSQFFENGSDHFYQVDVMSSTSQSSTVFNLAFQTEFNPSAFGDNLVFNNTIEVDISNINSSGVYQVNITDENGGTAFKVAITNSIAPELIDPNNLLSLEPTPIKIATITMKIKNCNEAASLKFTNAPDIMIENLEWEGSPTFGAPYTAITYGPTDDLILCPTTECFTISPSSSGAGNHSVLTLSGSNFDTEKGMVFFRSDATFSTTTFTTGENKFDFDPDENGVIDWSDTQIKIRVPSVGTGDPNCPGITYSKGTAATGIVKIKKNNGDIINSCNNLHVPFSINNVRIERPENSGNFEAYRIRLLTTNDNGGYTISISKELEEMLSGDNAENKVSTCVDAAILDWKCVTKVNWTRSEVLSDLSNQGVDGINLIHFANPGDITNSVETAVTQFEGRITPCVNDEFDYIYYLEEFDISIRRPTDAVPEIAYYVNAIDGNVPTGQMDFYSLILHELGHAHLLKHTLNNDQVMFKILNFSENKRALSVGDIDGGKDVMDNLDGFTGTCIDPYDIQPMVPFIPDETCITSTYEYDFHDSNLIQVFPNPTNGVFVLKFQEEMKDDIEISVFDNLGRTVLKEKVGGNLVSKSGYKVDISRYKYLSGIYLLTVKSQYNFYSKKIFLNHEH